MNLRGKDRLRILLMGAVAVGVFGPHTVRSAGPTPKTVTRPAVSAPPQLLPAATTATVIPVAKTEPASSGKKSEVMRQLELLYEQDGREMPEMNTDIRPVPVDSAGTGTQANAGVASGPVQQTSPNGLRMQQPAAANNTARPEVNQSAAPAAPAPIPTAETKKPNPVVAFFKRLMPGHKETKPTKAPSQYRPDVAPVPPAGNVAQPMIAGQAPRQNAAAANGSALPLLDSQPRTPFAAADIAPDPLPKPLADLGDIPPSPDGNISAQAALVPPLFTEATSTNPAVLPDSEELAETEPVSPFTEMSEAEADKQFDLDPFSGLTLDETAGSANAPADNASAANAETKAPGIPAPSATDPEDPFADELKKLITAPEIKPEPPKLEAPATEAPSFDGIQDQATREKMKRIHERGSMKGLKGFCPVTLRDQRELVDAKPDFHSTFRGQKFHFADADAKLKFDEEPARYAPAAYGADVVALTRDKDVVEGSLDFAAWFKGRLYLFGTEETHDTFVANPSMYATPVGIE